MGTSSSRIAAHVLRSMGWMRRWITQGPRGARRKALIEQERDHATCELGRGSARMSIISAAKYRTSGMSSRSSSGYSP